MKFEYLIKQFSLMRPLIGHESVMNELGAEGWELISSSGDASQLVTVFKRQLAGSMEIDKNKKVVVKSPTGKIIGRQG